MVIRDPQQKLIAGYEKASGQLINLQKSCFIPSKHISLARQISMSRLTGLQPYKFPISYLGTPLFRGRPLIRYFGDLKRKVATKLEGWKSKMC